MVRDVMRLGRRAVIASRRRGDPSPYLMLRRHAAIQTGGRIRRQSSRFGMVVGCCGSIFVRTCLMTFARISAVSAGWASSGSSPPPIH